MTIEKIIKFLYTLLSKYPNSKLIMQKQCEILIKTNNSYKQEFLVDLDSITITPLQSQILEEAMYKTRK